jgi:hypothetical protein
MGRYWIYHELYEDIWVIRRGFITIGELEKNNITSNLEKYW